MRFMAITTLIVLLSCNSETDNQSESRNLIDIAEDARPDSNEINDSSAFEFPMLASVTNCAESTRAPELCEWGLAAHDIVLLEITETSLIESPSVDGKTLEVKESCEGIVEAGFRMNGIVKESVRGLSGKIAVDVGVRQYADYWSPAPWPILNDDGTIRWSPRVGIKVGDVIGLTLHKHPTEKTYGILGEHFFDIDQNNVIRFGDLSSECGAPTPKNTNGSTFAEIKREIRKCSSNQAVLDRRQAKEEIWQDPVFANLGICWNP